jgi:predicted nucleic acid-binding protein
VSYVELAPVFDGSAARLDEFLDGLGVDHTASFGLTDRRAAFSAWARHVSTKRAGKAKRRPVADALIGALAARHDGIITRNGGHFRSFYPQLTLVDPTVS